MAMDASAELNAQYTYRDIALCLIDDPARPERETMDERELADLAMNISEVGLIEPLVVKSVDDRFEVIAGHRRLLACRLVNYSPVPCRIRKDGDIDSLAILVAENAHREDVNPVEEARFYARVLTEKADNDVDKLCLIVRRNRNFVEDRLLLLLGYPEVVDALGQRRISIAVARALNKLKDTTRLLLLLDTAIQQGATARQVTEWVRDSDQLEPIILPPVDPNNPAYDGAALSAAYRMECVFCESQNHGHAMQMLWIHGVCLDMLKRMLNRETQAPAA